MASVEGIISILPRENCAFQVWHHGQMTPVFRAYTGYIIVGSVRIPRVFGVIVFSYNVVMILGFGQIKASLAVRNPYSEFAVA